jgi:hypothetical protein
MVSDGPEGQEKLFRKRRGRIFLTSKNPEGNRTEIIPGTVLISARSCDYNLTWDPYRNFVENLLTNGIAFLHV